MATNKIDKSEHLIQTCKIDGSVSLDLSKMNITQISDELLTLDHVEHLYLEGNKLQALPDSFFDKLSSLKWLDLRNNELRRIPSSIGSHKSLTNLLLSGNSLTELPVELGNLTTLKGINFSDNPLEFPPTAIQQQGIQGILEYMEEKLRDRKTDQMTHNSDNAQGDLTPELDQSDFITNTNDDVTQEKMTDYEAITENLSFGIGQLMHHSDGYGSTKSSSNSKKINTRSDSIKNKIGKPSISSAKTSSIQIGEENQVSVHKIQQKIDEDEKKMSQKRDNQQKDHQIQQLKNENVLHDWRQEGKRLQRNKQMEARLNPGAEKPTITPPYGIQDNPGSTNETQTKADAAPTAKESLLSKLEDRIKSHTIQLSKKFTHRSASEELADAEKNLNVARQHQRELRNVKAAKESEFMAYNPVA